MLPYVNDNKNEINDEQPVSPNFHKDQEKKLKWYNAILLNRESKVIISFIILAVILPLVLYHLVVNSTIDLPPQDGLSFGSCVIAGSHRIPCGPGNVTRNACHSQCCYDLTTNACFHRIPSRFSYVSHRSWTEDLDLQPRIETDPFMNQPNIQIMRISVNEISPKHLSFTMYDSQIVQPITGSRLPQTEYSYTLSMPEMYIQVTAPQGIIFSTIRGPIIAANNIWEIAFKLTNETMFGLGEIPLKYDTVKIIYSNKNDDFSIPLIFAKLNNCYHGFLIDSETPTEVSILEDNQVLIRTIAVTSLKFHLFVGPTPEDIMEDVMEFIGFNNQLEFWMLGPHVCNEMSVNTELSYQNLETFLQNARTDNVYFESHCGVAPIVYDTNYELADMETLMNGKILLHSYDKRFVPHISPYFKYINSTEPEEEDINIFRNTTTLRESFCLKDESTNNVYKGVVNDKEILYPDYEFINGTNIFEDLWPFANEVDGIVLENNWPLDQSGKQLDDAYSKLPYFNQRFESAFSNTPAWNSIRPNDETYMYKHNMYGSYFAKYIQEIAKPNIPITTTSNWMNLDFVLNRQNVETSWSSLHKELIAASLGGISGQWFWSSPVCGDTEDFDHDYDTSLCSKWYMSSTFMPLIKIHSKNIRRDPLGFTDRTHRSYMINALNVRLSLHPYIYTTLQNGPLLRPMFYQYPYSESLSEVTTQFSVGNDLLIVPNLLPRQSFVTVWMPPGVWYELWSGIKLDAKEGQSTTMTTTEADFLTLIEGGKVLIIQREWKETAEATRLESNFTIITALHCVSGGVENPMSAGNSSCYAEGNIYLTRELTLLFKADEEQIQISYTGNDLTSLCSTDLSIWAHYIEEIRIYGLHTDLNNFDYHKSVIAAIDLCELQTENEILFQYIENVTII